MKKVFRNKFFLMAITGIICITGTITATTLYNSNQISYGDSDVKSALDDLYTKTSKSKVTSYTVSTVTTITDTSTGIYGYTWDLKTIPNYQNLVLWDNLFVRLDQTYISTDSPRGGSAFMYSYDATNGILTFTASCKQRPNGLVIFVLG